MRTGCHHLSIFTRHTHVHTSDFSSVISVLLIYVIHVSQSMTGYVCSLESVCTPYAWRADRSQRYRKWDVVGRLKREHNVWKLSIPPVSNTSPRLYTPSDDHDAWFKRLIPRDNIFVPPQWSIQMPLPISPQTLLNHLEISYRICTVITGLKCNMHWLIVSPENKTPSCLYGSTSASSTSVQAAWEERSIHVLL